MTGSFNGLSVVNAECVVRKADLGQRQFAVCAVYNTIHTPYGGEPTDNFFVSGASFVELDK